MFKKFLLFDDGNNYIYFKDDNSPIDLGYGELLKDLIYIDADVFGDAYSELVKRLSWEAEIDNLDLRDASEDILRLDAYINSIPHDISEDILRLDAYINSIPHDISDDISGALQNNYQEAYYLAQSILGYRIQDDIRAVISKDHVDILCAIIACDLYNAAIRCDYLSKFSDYLPSLFNINNYQELLRIFLMNRECNDEIKKFFKGGTIELSFLIEESVDVYFISSLDQLIRLEIKNLMDKKSQKIQYYECEVCHRLFLRSGSGSYKKVRCSYPYKVSCDSQKPPKTGIEKYKDKLVGRINKHFLRKRNIINDDIDWPGRCRKKIDELIETGKTTDEIIEYMENTWWKAVKKYDGNNKNEYWNQF